MNTHQSQLYADHYNFLRLLNFLESEIGCYETDNPQDARLSIILDIFDYIQAYPERWHHPLEDVIFGRLIEKQVPNADQIEELKTEHKSLERLTRNASELFTSIAHDVVVPTEKLLSATREFIRQQRAHIDKENNLVYPLFATYISDAEWRAIGEQIQHEKDPLFQPIEEENGQLSPEEEALSVVDHQQVDNALKAEFRNLYSLIMRAERRVNAGATARARHSA